MPTSESTVAVVLTGAGGGAVGVGAAAGAGAWPVWGWQGGSVRELARSALLVHGAREHTLKSIVR